uniref:Sodium/hydrogen exchanger n=1 Tax=Syphacia muris TaxID=451379 RepID=A0A0N5AVX8_9BILA
MFLKTIGNVIVVLIAISHAVSCEETAEVPDRYQIATLDWEKVNIPFVIAIWLLVASVAKIVFHIWPQVSEMFPDSSLLIAVGLVIGIVLTLCGVDRHKFSLGSETFFLYLLPPLVFDAGYFLPSRQFFDNLGSVLTLALIGTIWNFLSVGISLWAIGLTGVFNIDIPFLHYMLFASLIVDVDPVAVIVIFEELQVNVDLHIAVFGESLLNDGVSVVIYKMMLTYSEMTDSGKTLIVQDYVYGFISFLLIAIGGLGIGLIYAFITSYTTKYTDNIPILIPVFVLGLPFCAYLTCEAFGLSSIIGIVFCGAAMRPYVQENIPEKAFSVLSISAETVIFVFLGLSTVSSDHHWNSAFIIVTVTLCILYRTLGVTVLCGLLNKRRLNKYSKVDQFIIAYGGLRGAIAYGLVVALPDTLPTKKLFVTSCIVVIYWTVFLQGLTIRPIASFLEVERKKVYKKKMIDHIYEKLIDYTMAGMEDIAGIKGHASLRIALVFCLFFTQ